MSKQRIICTTNNVEYIHIRHAMCEGVRTMEELETAVPICKTCDGCQNEVPQILTSVCGCKKGSLQTVIDAVHNGADTVEKVGEATGIGTACGRCKRLVQNVIDLGR